MDMNRAYSLLTVKSLDATAWRFTGVASTPKTDRAGDIVESLGLSFINPLPLLLYHDKTLPVGTVTFDAPTKHGVRFTAQLADPTTVTSTTLRERLLETWDLVRSQLVRGVSIGFRPFEDAMELIRDAKGQVSGIRFNKSELLELSLVTVPANADATIDTIKSFDHASRAASGVARAVPSYTPGVSGESAPAPGRKDAPTMKTYAEQITLYTRQRDEKSTRMGELMNKAADDGTTLDAEQQTEYDALNVEKKSIDAHLVRLAELEQQNKDAAVEAKGTTPADAAAARNGGTRPVIRMKENLEPGIEFTRLVICKAASFLEMQRGNFVSAADVAKERYPEQGRIHQILKAPVPAGNTTNPAYAGVLVDLQNLQNEFVEFLRPQTIVGRFGQNGIPGLRRVPFNVRFTGQTSDAEAYWVGEGKPKPLTSVSFDVSTLTWAKLATIAVITEELARFSSPSAEQMVRDAIVSAIIRRMDIDFINPDKALVAGVSPASITNGLTAIPSSGSSGDAVRQDLFALLSSFTDADNPVTNLVLIMPSGLSLALGLMTNSLGQAEFPGINQNGGNLRGIPVITSNYASSFSAHGNLVIAVNPSEIFLADDGQVSVDVSREASLEMSDAPTQNGMAGTGASLVSLWQNNMIGLRAERFVNWARRRATAVSYMEDVTWGSVGSPAP